MQEPVCRQIWDKQSGQRCILLQPCMGQQAVKEEAIREYCWGFHSLWYNTRKSIHTKLQPEGLQRFIWPDEGFAHSKMQNLACIRGETVKNLQLASPTQPYLWLTHKTASDTTSKWCICGTCDSSPVVMCHPVQPLYLKHYLILKERELCGVFSAFLFHWTSQKRSSIWWDLKGAALHKQPSRVFRGFWNINKRARRYIILLQQLWQQRENVSELCYKSHNTVRLHIQAWLVPRQPVSKAPSLQMAPGEALCMCVRACVCECALVIWFYSWNKQ